jgi:hypothetical protein
MRDWAMFDREQSDAMLREFVENHDMQSQFNRTTPLNEKMKPLFVQQLRVEQDLESAEVQKVSLPRAKVCVAFA